MRLESRGTLLVLKLAVAVGVFAASPAWAQSSSTHYGYYDPKPLSQSGQPVAKPAPPARAASHGGDTSGNRPTVTTSTAQSGGGAGVAGGAGSQVVSVPGVNGDSKTLVDQESETVKLNDKTTRTIERIYGQDADGKRLLIGVKQTDTTDLGGGKSRSVSTTSQRDADSNMQQTEREVSDSVTSGPHTTTTNTTVFTPGVNGQLDPSQKIHQVDRTDTNAERTTSTQQVPDGNGGWTTSKMTDTTVAKQGKEQQTEDQKVYTIDGNGNLTLSQRVVTRDWKAASGQKQHEIDTYATTPGGESTAQGGGLTLMQRETTVQTTKPDGTVETRDQTEARSLVAPDEALKVTGAVVEVDKPTKSGAMETQRTVLGSDGNGQLTQVSVFTGQQPKPTPQTAPAQAASDAKQANAKKPDAKKPDRKPQ